VDEVGQPKVSREKNDADDSAGRTLLRVRENAREEVGLLMLVRRWSSSSWNSPSVEKGGSGRISDDRAIACNARDLILIKEQFPSLVRGIANG